MIWILIAIHLRLSLLHGRAGQAPFSEPLLSPQLSTRSVRLLPMFPITASAQVGPNPVLRPISAQAGGYVSVEATKSFTMPRSAERWFRTQALPRPRSWTVMTIIRWAFVSEMTSGKACWPSYGSRTGNWSSRMVEQVKSDATEITCCTEKK